MILLKVLTVFPGAHPLTKKPQDSGYEIVILYEG